MTTINPELSSTMQVSQSSAHANSALQYQTQHEALEKQWDSRHTVNQKVQGQFALKQTRPVSGSDHDEKASHISAALFILPASDPALFPPLPRPNHGS